MNTREHTLQSINDQLTKLGLRSLHKLGDHTKGEFEITGINAIHDHAKKYFIDITFDTIMPGGNVGIYTLRFHANGIVSDGAIFVVRINTSFVIVKQWRATTGTWTYEVPRGFGEAIDTAEIKGTLGSIKLGDLPLGTLKRELGEEVIKDAKIKSITALGPVAENTGTHVVFPRAYLIEVDLDPKKLPKEVINEEEHLKLKLWDKERIERAIGSDIFDAHSLSALFYTWMHLYQDTFKER